MGVVFERIPARARWFNGKRYEWNSMLYQERQRADDQAELIREHGDLARVVPFKGDSPRTQWAVYYRNKE